LDTITSTGCSGRHRVTSSTEKLSRPPPGAFSIIAGEESNPWTSASGQRPASVAVSSPVPHPASTTWAGRSAAILATRSKKGRERSSA
jgi:hypothetical protein